MKSLVASVLITLLFTFDSNSQWQIDPLNPQTVCNEPGQQNAYWTFPNQDGSLLVVWLDGRNGSNQRDIYGQLYDAQGYEQWESQGRVILDIEEDIPHFGLVRLDEDDYILSWYANVDGVAESDGMYATRMNGQGEFTWSEPLHYAGESTQGSLSAFGYSYAQYVRTNENTITVMMFIFTYGYDRIRITSFDLDGNLNTVFNGVEIGPIDSGLGFISAADEDAVYVYYSTSNGMGAALMANKVSSTGLLLWPEWVSVTSGAPGIGYQFTGVGDPEGITFAWVAGDNDIYAQRINSGGALEWPAPLAICTANGTSHQFIMRRKDDVYTMTWRDTRTGLNAIYKQSFDTAGNILFEENGAELIANAGTEPNQSFNFSFDNSLTLMYRSLEDGQFREKVQRFLEDGTPVHENGGIVVAQGPGLTSNNNSKSILQAGNKQIVLWNSYVNVFDIQISLVEIIPSTIEEFVQACNFYVYDGQILTESGTYEFSLPELTTYVLHLEIIEFIPEVNMTETGLVATPEGLNYSWIDCDSGEGLGTDSFFQPIESGNYAVQVSNEICSISTDCIYFPVYTYLDTTIQSCGPYLLDGIQLNESGTYTLTLPGEVILTLELIISELDASIESSGTTLFALPADAELYEWIDCDTGEALGNEALLEVSYTGNFACTVTQGPCVVETDCVFVEYTTVEEHGLGNALVYPNPANSFLFIQTERQLDRIRIIGLEGQLIFEESMIPGEQIRIDVAHLSGGIYVLELISGTELSRFKWVKN